MPIEVWLRVHGERAWPRLSGSPAVRAAWPGAQRSPTGDVGVSVDVTALAVRDSPYGRARIAAADAGLLARHARVAPRSLGLGDLRPRGARRAWVAGEVRAPLLAWLRAVAFDTETPLTLAYAHERGDWPYETAIWTWYPDEALWWRSWDGGSTVLAEGSLFRPARDRVGFHALAVAFRSALADRAGGA